jgi:intracellular sulfur oxidation DsrE/DsrF family protein
MVEVDRRAIVGAMALVSAGAIASGASAQAPAILPLSEIKKEADVACLYHCDFGDAPRFVQMITNISNHYSVVSADPFALQLALVVHGAGVKFFFENLEDTNWRDEIMVPKIFPTIEAQAKNGLKVYLCDITFQRQKLDRSKVRKADWIRFVPSGVATVAALQAKGFAYLKVG